MEDFLCKICNSKTEKIFVKNILKKHDVSYYKCLDCGLIQTEKPYWLEESYASAITSLDIGLVNRNIQYSGIVEDILYKHFDKKARFLDFAGGYGMFTRIMRDKGFDFYHEDKYCDNLFAKHFEIGDLPTENKKFELVTAFELMEHIKDPFKELDYIFSMTKSFLFSTELVPANDVENWWYLGTEHGQHISFYTVKCIKKIAKKYNKKYYTNGYLHLITDKNDKDIFKNKIDVIGLTCRFLKKHTEKIKHLPSKTQSDFDFIRNKYYNESK